MTGKPHLYLIASGSNRRHHRHGLPEHVVRAAHLALECHPDIDLIAEAPVVRSAPMGAAQRDFANSAVYLSTQLSPPDLLDLLKNMERDFGRKSGKRWGDRVLDLDIILWSGGIWQDDGLSIPHPGFRERGFVLRPLLALAPDWRDPISGRTIGHLSHMLDRPRRKP